ncbi:hypothetical protein ES703_01579 [subsurface metagenome]
MKTIRAFAAFIALVIGVYLLLEGVYPSPQSLVDATFMGLGAALILGYFQLIGDYFQRRLRMPPEMTFMPVLLVLGLVVLGFGLVRPGLASIGLKLSLAIPGLVLAVYAVFRTLKAIKERGL